MNPTYRSLKDTSELFRARSDLNSSTGCTYGDVRALLQQPPIAMTPISGLLVSSAVILTTVCAATIAAGGGFVGDPYRGKVGLCSETFAGYQLPMPCKGGHSPEQPVNRTHIIVPIAVTAIWVLSIATIIAITCRERLFSRSGFIARFRGGELEERIAERDDNAVVSAGKMAGPVGERLKLTDSFMTCNFEQLAALHQQQPALLRRLVAAPKLLSGRQLTLWRLLFKVYDSSQRDLKALLSDRGYRMLMVSEPLFVEMAIRGLPHWDDKIARCCDKLLGQTLAQEVRDRMTKPLAAVVEALRKGASLPEAVESCLDVAFHRDLLDTMPLGKELLTYRYRGLPKRPPPLELYELMMTAVRCGMQREEQALVRKLPVATLIETLSLKGLLDDAVQAGAAILTTKVDQHLASKLDDEGLSELSTILPIAQRHSLLLTLQVARARFIEEIEDYILPFSAKRYALQLEREFTLVEELFDDQRQEEALQRLAQQVKEWLETFPEKSEKLWTAASSCGCEKIQKWIQETIAGIYRDNREIYELHWGSPPSDLDIELVVL